MSSSTEAVVTHAPSTAGKREGMTAGQPHVDLETWHYFISCLAYEDLMPPDRQRRISIFAFEYAA